MKTAHDKSWLYHIINKTTRPPEILYIHDLISTRNLRNTRNYSAIIGL